MLGTVSLELDIRQRLQGDVHHVLLRPHYLLVVGIIRRVTTLRRDLQRNRIFVIVVRVIGTQTNEGPKVSIRQSGNVVNESFGMCEELKTSVLAKIVIGRLVNSHSVLRTQTCNLHGKRLLVLLAKLGLAGISHTGNTRR